MLCVSISKRFTHLGHSSLKISSGQVGSSCHWDHHPMVMDSKETRNKHVGSIHKLILIFCAKNYILVVNPLLSEPFGTSYRLLKVLFTVFTAAAGSPTSLLRKMKLQVSFMTSSPSRDHRHHSTHPIAPIHHTIW